jgi:predicted transcriptional regulator of viral defense system
MQSEEIIKNFRQQGRRTFLSSEFAAQSGTSGPALAGRLRRLREGRLIVTPVKGFHMICYDQPVLGVELYLDALMKHLDSRYYVAALSAAQYHGASHQKPMQYQVCVSKTLRNIDVDSQPIKFILNEDVAWVSTVQKKTASGYLTFSSLAVTCYDLVRYPQLAGGINNAATCLYELLEESKDSLADLADVRFKTNILQRLGCILDRVELEKPALTLEKILKNRPLHWTPLVRGQTTKGSIKNTKWMILENETLEPDL